MRHLLRREEQPIDARHPGGDQLKSLTLPTIIVSGLVDGLNPCAFGVLLSFVAILLAGVALGEARPRLWRVGGAYAAGMFGTYLLLGAGIISVVSFFASTHLPVRIMGLVVVVLGVWTLKDALFPGVGWSLSMPAALHGSVRAALSQSTPAGLFVAGALVGLCTVPCSGTIYLAVLALLAREPLPVRMAYLIIYNLAFIAPLLALLAFVASRRTLNRIGHWYLPRKQLAKGLLGALTLILGFVILLTA